MSSSTDLWNRRAGRLNAYRSDPPTLLSTDPQIRFKTLNHSLKPFLKELVLLKYLLCFEGLYIHQWP